MIQKEDPHKKPVLPESVPNDDLDLLYLASPSAPLMVPPLYDVGIPESGAEYLLEYSVWPQGYFASGRAISIERNPHRSR